MAHNSMMPSIKCSSCGLEVNLMELGEHSCSRVSVEKLDTSALDKSTAPADKSPTSPQQPPSPSDSLQVPGTTPLPAKRPTSPLKHEVSLDTSADPHGAAILSESEPDVAHSHSPQSETMPEDFNALAPKALRPKPPPINPNTANVSNSVNDPLTPADSLKSAEQAPSKPAFQAAPSASRHLSPPTPVSAIIPSANTNFRPPSFEPQEQQQSPQPQESQWSPGQWSQSSMQSPPFMQSTSAPISPQGTSSPSTPQLGLFPPLRPQLSKSTSNLTETFPTFERKKPEENKILNLFRRKSTKHINKKSISAPALTKSTMALDDIPAVPIMSPRLMTNSAALSPPLSSPASPEPSNTDHDGRALPAGPAPPRPSRPATVIIEQLHATGVLPPARAISPDRPPPAIPQAPDSPDKDLPAPPTPDKDAHLVPPSPEKELPPPPPRVESPALPQIPEVEPAQEDDNDSGASTARQRSRSRSQNRSRSHSRSPKASQQLSPATTATRAGSIEQLPRPMAHAHSPTGSSSSHASQPVSESHTDGSVSTPPLTSVSSFAQWKSSEEEPHNHADHQLHSASRAANFSRPRGATSSSSASGSVSQPRSILRRSASTDFAPAATGRPARESTSSSASNGASLVDESSTEGSITRPRLPPIPDEEQQQQRSHGHGHGRQPSRSGSVKSKGNCRGCGTAITGKSVKASDGRLTGRYHKECFVCKTCKEPFPSADFYVINDEPYCHTHYHVLNGSTCFQCRKGIEGQFLQIFPNRKFHAICFSCCECRQPLSRDYYESKGQFYCEADARRIFHSGRGPAPGRMMMPERRVPALIRA